MSIGEVQVQCQHCKKWFRSSLMQSDEMSFQTMKVSNSSEGCPYCKKATSVDSDKNMRFAKKD